MPKIVNEEIDSKYFEKYLLTAIMQDGTIISILKGEKDGFHKEAFSKLITEIEQILERKMKISPQEGLYKNLEEFVNNHIIPISTLYIEQQPYKLSSDVQIIMFPKNVKEKQLKSMQKLMVTFDEIGCVYFNEEGNPASQEKVGLEKLKKYVENKINNIENDLQH